MYPNPQEALPLALHPDIAQYRKIAKDLLEAQRSATADSIQSWAMAWIRRLARTLDHPKTLKTDADIRAAAERLAHYA